MSLSRHTNMNNKHGLFSTNVSHTHAPFFLITVLLFLPTAALCECTCDAETEKPNRAESLRYKLAAIAAILMAGGLGVSLPLVARKTEALNPDNDIFFMIKAFAAGVILATGFIHILPEAFDRLTSPCLRHTPWAKFPFTGFVAMVASIGTLMVDSLTTAFYKKMSHRKTLQQGVVDAEGLDDHDHHHAGHVHVHVHSHATHDHDHACAQSRGSSIPSDELGLPELVRRRIVSQVLELGIVVHSVIIGISLGASENPNTIKPLLAALSFHQFFEGMGLGGCISQAKFNSASMVVMALFFSLTAPAGIAVGIGMSSVYDETSSTALIVEGIFNSASAGILIYMALVDLLAADFMNPRMLSNGRLHFGANVSLLLGAGCMSVLAKWA